MPSTTSPPSFDVSAWWATFSGPEKLLTVVGAVLLARRVLRGNYHESSGLSGPILGGF